jgi:hypothetical protein
MGFLARSAFWLGLVYSAMPFDSGRPIAVGPTGTATSLEGSPSLPSLASATIAAAPKGSAEPLRHVPREKSGRAEAVRPLIANHIRSPEGQT